MINYLKNNKVFSFLILISCLSVVGAIVYHLYALNLLGAILSLVIALLMTKWILSFKPLKQEKYNKKRIDYILTITYLVLFVVGLFILYSVRSSEAIISPWKLIPEYFFAIYTILTTILVFSIMRKNRLNPLLISLHYFISFSIAMIVYRIGYGFDPFIHQGIMELIDENKEVNPRPFYYIGQYSFSVIIHKFTGISLAMINKALVPVLASILIPFSLLRFLKRYFKSTKTNLLTTLFALLIPFSMFIVTIPQNLAYMFLIILILLGLTIKKKEDLIILYLLAITTFSIHPLAGIPAILFVLMLQMRYLDIKNGLKKILNIVLFILTTIAIPISFYAVGNNSINLKNIFGNINLLNPSTENFILNFTYFYGFNIGVIIFILSIIGIVIAIKNKNKFKKLFVSLHISIALFISYILSTMLSFNSLIEYERNNYSNRILLLVVIFLSPFILIAIRSLIKGILKQEKIVKISMMSFLIILVTTSLYISYPRIDNYFNSRGFSSSENDLRAVRWIESESQDEYIVLANQQVSVAALSQFGFNRYYDNDIYFYPIPTGGKLYTYYLDMVYKYPSRETMNEAMDLVNVNKSYFVINKYWWSFEKIIEEAKLESDSWEVIGDRELYIFKYIR